MQNSFTLLSLLLLLKKNTAKKEREKQINKKKQKKKTPVAGISQACNLIWSVCEQSLIRW